MTSEQTTSEKVNDNADGGRRGFRATVSDNLCQVVSAAYGFEWEQPTDLGGSSNLNVRIGFDDRAAHVVRVYRPHVTAERLSAIQDVRRHLEGAGIPCDGLVRTLDGEPWVRIDDRLAEVERFVPHDGEMDTWDHLRAGMPILARVHDALRDFPTTEAARSPLFANYISASEARRATASTAERVRGWKDVSAGELAAADQAELLASRLETLEAIDILPSQLSHGDFWDNNVFFRGDEFVHLTDFDFMGERPRVDDLALTLYFAAREKPEIHASRRQLKELAQLVDAYGGSLASPLSASERRALPLAVARQPLLSIGGWVRILDSEEAAREHFGGSVKEIEWGLAVLDQLDRWREALS